MNWLGWVALFGICAIVGQLVTVALDELRDRLKTSRDGQPEGDETDG